MLGIHHFFLGPLLFKFSVREDRFHLIYPLLINLNVGFWSIFITVNKKIRIQFKKIIETITWVVILIMKLKKFNSQIWYLQI